MLCEIFAAGTIAMTDSAGILIGIAAALLLGMVCALIHQYHNPCSKEFAVTLALLPVIVAIVILTVNGNLGTGVAVAGAFSLVRFRSVPGNAKDICSIFLAMAVGLAVGTGYLLVGGMLVLSVGLMNMLYENSSFGENKQEEKELRIIIPETLDYSGLFDDLFHRYTRSSKLIRVKTTNLGSLYQLTYHIVLTEKEREKEFLDHIRCRNGNLDIICGKISTVKDSL